MNVFERRSAIFSEDRAYRHMLRVAWDETLPCVAFVGLNPSTADDFNDDPTSTRMIGFARDWGYGSMLILNAFDLKATDPKEMMKAADPIGPQGDVGAQLRLLNPRMVVVCWGKKGNHRGRAEVVTAQITRWFSDSRLKCFGYNCDGTPKHPLYLPADTKLVPFPKEVC